MHCIRITDNEICTYKNINHLRLIGINLKKNNNIINEKIRADQVILIDVNGDNLGLVNTDVALKKAKDINMDLVMVSNQSSNPVVCKMLDFDKYIFDKEKI